MATIEQQLEQLKRQQEKLLAQLDKKRANKTFLCVCGERHKLKQCDAVQTFWYEQPHGCNGGDIWHPSELHIVCPTTGVENRILFDNTDVDWSLRSHYNHNPEAQFSRMYKHVFKSVNERHGDDRSRSWKNNAYFDRNREFFGLVLKSSK